MSATPIPYVLPRRAVLALLLIGMVVPLVFAAITHHTWEDYYITYRASKHLAMGDGLVFTPGERLHTFTSPLGVLLPAATCWLTGGQDLAALWLFRVLCAGALGLTAVLLAQLVGMLWRGSRWTMALVLGMLLLDAKDVQFTINGMETAWMLLFLTCMLHALLVPHRYPRVYLGLAWAGLMWTRPDSFIFIGAAALAALIFHDPATMLARTRGALLRHYLAAGALTTALYLPWFAWATWYYGTPIPNTITAKGLRIDHSFVALLAKAMDYPLKNVLAAAHADLTYLPTYFLQGGWPLSLVLLGMLVPLATTPLWLPGVPRLGRMLALTFLLTHAYLIEITMQMPWYIPPVALLGVLSLASLGEVVRRWLPALHQAGQLTAAALQDARTLLRGAVVALLLAQGVVLLCAGLEMYYQQRLIEEGNRRTIGLWLRAHAASPRDSVFLECLGYIGFYSNLKMYDDPGLGSREVVNARRVLGDEYAALIGALQPDWLVLRPSQVQELQRWPEFGARYELAQTFDQSAALAKLAWLPGSGYLAYDQTFYVLHRRAAPPPTP